MTSIASKIRGAVEEGGVKLLIQRTANKVRWSWPFYRQSYLEAVTHDIKGKPPEVPTWCCPVGDTTPEDVQIAERVLAAFRKAILDEKPRGEKDLWSNVLENGHADFHAISDDAAKVAEYLNDVNRRGLGVGVASSTLSEYEAISKDPRLENEFGVLIKDVMVSFAEAVGAVPYNVHENLYLDEDEVLEKIELKVGNIEPSDAEGGVYKAEIGGRLWGARDFWSAHIAKKVADKGRIAEIGAGMGKVAWYALQFGAKEYSIYDLPIINVLQAWFLIKSGAKVVLYGEEGEGVKVLPYWKFREGSFDLTLNVDSFPEMHESIVADYLEAIKGNSRELLSINRENGDSTKVHSHCSVSEVAERVGGLRRVSRSPFWIYKNYIEELYIP